MSIVVNIATPLHAHVVAHALPVECRAEYLSLRWGDPQSLNYSLDGFLQTTLAYPVPLTTCRSYLVQKATPYLLTI